MLFSLTWMHQGAKAVSCTAVPQQSILTIETLQLQVVPQQMPYNAAAVPAQISSVSLAGPGIIYPEQPALVPLVPFQGTAGASPPIAVSLSVARGHSGHQLRTSQQPLYYVTCFAAPHLVDLHYGGQGVCNCRGRTGEARRPEQYCSPEPQAVWQLICSVHSSFFSYGASSWATATEFF